MKKIVPIITASILTVSLANANNLSDFDGYTAVKIISGSKDVNAIPTDRTQYDLTCGEFHEDFVNGELKPNSYEICQPSNGTYSAVLPIKNEDGSAMCSISLAPTTHKIVIGTKGCSMGTEYPGSVYSQGDDDNKTLIIDFSKVDM